MNEIKIFESADFGSERKDGEIKKLAEVLRLTGEEVNTIFLPTR